MPGVGEWGKKYIKFPSCFQDTKHGIKTRADASGVIIRAEFRVVKGGAGAEVEGEGMGIGDAKWVLVEDVEVTCNWWLMPFVKGKMEQAHRDVCRKVVEKVEMQRRQETVAQTSPRGKGRASGVPDNDTHTGYAETQKEHYGSLNEQQLGSLSRGTEGLAEAEATGTQRVDTVAPLPEKITYQ